MAKKPGQNSTKKPSLDMIISLAGFITGILAQLSFERVQSLLMRKSELRDKLQEVFGLINVDLFSEMRADWEHFYDENFGIIEDFSDTEIPQKPNVGSWRLILIPQGLGLDNTVKNMRELFPVHVNTLTEGNELLFEVPINTRIPETNYAVWVRNDKSPDSEYLDKDPLIVDPHGVIGVTLLERLVFDMKYYIETRRHLDSGTKTLCTGSRNVHGQVPIVYWVSIDNEVHIDSRTIFYANQNAGLRSVVL